MSYDFDTLTQRRGTGSMKWDEDPDPQVLPMWVADMDFRAAPCITEALRRRVDHGIFGYCHVPDAYYDAAMAWMKRRHGFDIRREWMIYTSGVVPAISAVIKALSRPGDGVLVQTPVYNCFFSSIRNNGCVTVENPLVYKDNTYFIDYEDLEAKLARDDVRLMLLCNPHNPAGRVWTAEELRRIGEMALRHGVTVISDEIHCELTFPGHTYTPFATLSDDFLQNSVTCLSPSKAFNIAGLQIANIVCADSSRRAAIDRAINDNEVCDVNPFGVDALIAAYTQGEPWLRALLAYLWDNYQLVCSTVAEKIHDIKVTKLEGTYLVWLDCRALGRTSDELAAYLLDKEKLWLTSGTVYGADGQGFLRLNIACPRARLAEGLSRLCRGLSDTI